jgi:hypothetical protein
MRVLSEAAGRTLSAHWGEREEGPVAQRWEGEVGIR